VYRTPLIALARIGSLDLLKSLFTTINIPQTVYHEVVTSGSARPAAQAVAAANWIVTRAVTNRRAVSDVCGLQVETRGEKM